MTELTPVVNVQATSNNWMWTTYRRMHSHNSQEHQTGNLVVDMLHGRELPKVTGYTDHDALVNLVLGIMVWETNSSHMPHAEGVEPIAYLIVDYINSTGAVCLGETLDSFAAKVGAPPRPKTEIPAAFRDA